MRVAALLLCVALLPTTQVARADSGGKVAVGLNLGVDIPTGGDESLGPGGVWHLVLELSASSMLLLALEIGTAANETDTDRTVVADGITWNSSLHAVSTLGVLGRYAIRRGKLRPYLALGAGWYTSWDDVHTVGGPSAGFVTRSGFGLLAGAGSAFWLGRRWDVYAEGLYHHAADAGDDARYIAFQSGVRFYLGRKRSSQESYSKRLLAG